MIEKEILEKALKYNYSTELDKLRQHIVDLRIVSTSFESHLQEKDKEIERLNNIINEFEQELIKKLEAVKTIRNTLSEEVYIVNPHIDVLEQEYNYFYKKLQELKGSDKE